MCDDTDTMELDDDDDDQEDGEEDGFYPMSARCAAGVNCKSERRAATQWTNEKHCCCCGFR